MLAASRRLLRDVAQPGELQEVLRGLPHNITTEMDLQLWELTEEIRNDEASRRVLTDLAVPDVLQRYRERALPRRGAARSAGHSCVASAIAPSLRSISVCLAGQMIRAICWA